MENLKEYFDEFGVEFTPANVGQLARAMQGQKTDRAFVQIASSIRAQGMLDQHAEELARIGNPDRLPDDKVLLRAAVLDLFSEPVQPQMPEARGAPGAKAIDLDGLGAQLVERTGGHEWTEK